MKKKYTVEEIGEMLTHFKGIWKYQGNRKGIEEWWDQVSGSLFRYDTQLGTFKVETAPTYLEEDAGGYTPLDLIRIWGGLEPKD